MKIRPCAPGDEARVAAIALEAWRPIYEGYRAAMGAEMFAFYRANWEQEKKASVLKACRGEDHFAVLVAEIAGHVVGFASYQVDAARGRGVIGNNAVDPSCCGRGVAAALYEAALERMRAAGLRYVSTVTGGDAAHAPARRAYEKAGFTTVIPSVTLYRRL